MYVRLYFAYGSNMSRARLEARVGPVDDLGWSSARDYCHRFNKRGADGSAKGNIVRLPGAVVHGVLYRLDAGQLEELAKYEGGYLRNQLRVLNRTGADYVESVSFEAHAALVAPGLVPTEQYVAHYEAGMREHGLPPDYVCRVLFEARMALRYG
ncbi:MAG: gamma-glutamylcyclotransferase family protein [Myxococcales bacterium]|jgi:hypothetical protein